MAEASNEANGASEGIASGAAGAAAAAVAAAVAAANSSSAASPSPAAGSEKSPPAVEIKLFLGRVPQSMNEDSLRPVFEEFGEVREVVIIRDKATGKHKNSAFVKMASIAAGDAAIRGLHNIRVLDASMGPMSVKYATGEAERLGLSAQACEPGLPQAKLFVGSLPRTLKEEELKAFFESYGQVDEVFIMKDNATGMGRGCAFVKLGQKEQALFAINSLNGKHTWEGCPRPMEVRFAESRAQRMGGAMGMMPRGGMGGPGGGPMGMGPRSGMGGGPMGGGGPRMSPGMGGGGGAPMPPSNNNPRAAGPWKEYFSPEGRPYYHNEVTGITTWERPPEFMHIQPPGPPGSAPGYGGAPSHMVGGGGFGGVGHGGPQGGVDDGSGAAGGRDQSGPPGANIFVFHVPNDWNYFDLLNAFSQFGNVLSARVAMDRQSGRNKGYGFVSYETPEAAAAAVAAMNGFLAGGKRLKVTIKKGEEQHAVRASPMAYPPGAGGPMGPGGGGGRDAQWGGGAYGQQTPGGYGAQGNFGGSGPPQAQRFAPY